jgi:hypothetical protein
MDRPSEFASSKLSVGTINDIPFYPEISPPASLKNDPKFDQICEILRAAM